MRTIAQETVPQIALRNCFKEIGVKSVYMWFKWKENSCSQADIFCRRFLLVMGSSHHHEEFWYFFRYEEIQELGSQSQLLKICKIWRPVLPVSPRAQTASFLISDTNAFRGLWKAAAAKAHGLTLLDVGVCCRPDVSDSLDPMDCNRPGSSVLGISQARIRKWVAFPFSRGSSLPRDGTHGSCTARGFLTTEPSGKSL